jgi:hypothetical protein
MALRHKPARAARVHTNARHLCLPCSVDALQNLFQTYYLPGYWFLPHFLFLAIMLTYTEMSKREVRRNPEGWWARNVQW